MNKNKLKAVMIYHGDIGKDLAEALGISRVTLSKKMNENHNFCFNQTEISLIKERYNLDSNEINDIFFSK